MTQDPNRGGSFPVILASGSTSRRSLLTNAGLQFGVEAAHVDEDEIKLALKAEGASAAQTAETLAELKAQRVSRRYPGVLVIGADQMLECNGVWFDKPEDLDHAAAHLVALRDKDHTLLSSVCVVRDGVRLWHHNEVATLTMRNLSDDFIKDYLVQVGEDALTSVGAYQLEGRGIQLFARIKGDYFSILGLPLLPLLDFLRGHGAVAK
ncbi:Maf family protein [Denitrobaculum tricleocarpae]|uniref:Nucleoside triphosphate pyrophosphatase n=1 Tax=Denitrobaculum tricleocarpae TaxID=2591009 RepID=A0A545TRX9_9PROT|nr:Maf family protein [Denitrobaculum tricleocarpae]TQV79978.1 septum formation protein Maf [Denitrobaculum tricleocarpae]